MSTNTEEKADYSAIKIKTSYFAASGKKPEAISIAVGSPRWMPHIDKFPELNPTREMLKMSGKDYAVEYDKILAKLNPHEIAMRLNGRIMLCWERPGEYCHRRIVADWLMKNCPGLVVPEIGYDGPDEGPEEYDARKAKEGPRLSATDKQLAAKKAKQEKISKGTPGQFMLFFM
jgi:hypothetical protein